jgi:hypothetical protein
VSAPPRWEPCVNHRGETAEAFVRDYFAPSDRQVGLIAGAGFDPRSAIVPELLANAAPNRVRGLFLREERPSPHAYLRSLAEGNVARLKKVVPDSQIESFEIFDKIDSAPVGGQRVISLLRRKFDPAGLTDLVIDFSALSIGVCFSITKYCCELAAPRGDQLNVHVVVLDHPSTDGAFHAAHCGRPSSPHGFKGEWQLDKWARAAKLWMPQLGRGKRTVLEGIHKFVVPHAVCPILPFPAVSPRSPDRLIEDYGELFHQSAWDVDSHDLIYAHEKSPVDLYRTILRIDDARQRVFAGTGGSQLILSPLGNKALALGMLMAALDRGLSAVLIESLAYNPAPAVLDMKTMPRGELVHIWLHGEAYSAIPTGGGHEREN